MGNVNVRKRGKVYQYQFEAAVVDGKRKQITKMVNDTVKKFENYANDINANIKIS